MSNSEHNRFLSQSFPDGYVAPPCEYTTHYGAALPTSQFPNQFQNTAVWQKPRMEELEGVIPTQSTIPGIENFYTQTAISPAYPRNAYGFSSDTELVSAGGFFRRQEADPFQPVEVTPSQETLDLRPWTNQISQKNSGNIFDFGLDVK